MPWLVLALLLIASPAQAQTVKWFMGVETGDLSEGVAYGATPSNCSATGVAGTFKTGAYGMGCILQAARGTPAGMGGTTIFERLWFKWQTGLLTDDRVVIASGTGPGLIEVYLKASNQKLYWTVSGGAAIATSTTALTIDTWYLIEVKMVIDASVGGVELKLNGATEFTSLATNTSAFVAFDIVAFGNSATAFTNPYIFDDMMVCSGAYCPAGGTIARQGTSGSPTYTAWTKNSCTSSLIENCWSETPFTATTPSASSTVLNDAQTMVVHDFATTQTGHGTETIGNTSTINACKTAMVANAGSTGTLTIRRRISASDTDTAKSITTTNAYYDDGIWTTTADILRNQIIEIGAKQGENTETQTVRDMWMMCDFSNASVAPKHRVIQQ